MDTDFGISFHDYAQEYRTEIIEALSSIIDPELGIDLVNLGLVYDVTVDHNKHCEIIMTLTAMGCPFTDKIVYDVTHFLSQIDGIQTVNVEFDFSRPWVVDRISRYGKIALGIRG